jgi:hypothetical protein
MYNNKNCISFHEIELRVTFTEEWRKRQMLGVYIGVAIINLCLLWFLLAGTHVPIGVAAIATINTAGWYLYASKHIEAAQQWLVHTIGDLIRNPRQTIVSNSASTRTAEEVLSLLDILDGLKDAIVAQTDVFVHTMDGQTRLLHEDNQRLYARVQRLRELLGDGLPRRKK